LSDSADVADTLIGGSGTDTLLSGGTADTLIAGSGSDLLLSTGNGDILIGNGGGSTLDGAEALSSLALYTASNIVVDLSAETAKVNGSSSSDTLLGITSAEVTGAGDTLIGGNGVDNLIFSGVGETLIAGDGLTTVTDQGRNGSLIDLATGTARLSGSSVSDTLVGITSAQASSSVFDTLIGGTEPADVLVSNDGLYNTLIAGSGTDTLLGDSGSDMDTLIAGTGTDTLIATNSYSDVLEGDADGSTLIAGTGNYGLSALYSGSNFIVDLATNTANLAGSSISDVLVGIVDARVTGSNNTLIGGAGADTLGSDGGGNTLIAGTGATEIDYQANNLIANMLTGTASIAGSSTSDTLIGITDISVFGRYDTIIGGAGADTLSTGNYYEVLIAGSGNNTLIASGVDTLIAGNGANELLTDLATSAYNTMIAGSGNDTLATYGHDNTLIGGSGDLTLYGDGQHNTLIGGSGATQLIYTSDDYTVDLAAGTANANMWSFNDTLIGITNALVSGASDTLIAGSGSNTLSATGFSDTLIASTGANSLSASGTSDYYKFAAGDGSAIITNGSSSNTTSSNELDFRDGLTDENLWFVQSGNNLQIDLMGTNTQVTIDGWFSSPGSQLSEITAGGLKLDTQLSSLVSAMAAYSAAHSGFDPTSTSQAPNDNTLQTAIAASWHS
jgi:Ca2+-binding RTX toxin-like protein